MTRPPAPIHMTVQNNGMGIALRVAAMVCMAGLAALVKWCSSRGVPVLEIIFFRNAFAFVPVLIYISRTSGFSVLKTKRPLGHLMRSTVGLTGMVCGFTAVSLLPLTESTALSFSAQATVTGQRMRSMWRIGLNSCSIAASILTKALRALNRTGARS